MQDTQDLEMTGRKGHGAAAAPAAAATTARTRTRDSDTQDTHHIHDMKMKGRQGYGAAAAAAATIAARQAGATGRNYRKSARCSNYYRNHYNADFWKECLHTTAAA